MTTSPRVLVGCDGSPESKVALEWAADYATATDGHLTLLSAWQWPTFQDEPITYGQWDPEEACEHTVNRLQAQVGLTAAGSTTEVVRGKPARVLTERSGDADLLVVGTHGLGALSRRLLGSVSSYSVGHARCPVAVVRAAGAESREGILVGLDDSTSSRAALRWAMDYADLTREPLAVVHVTPTPAPPIPSAYPITFTYPRRVVHRQVLRWMHEVVGKEQADSGRELSAGVSFHVLDGNPGQVMVEHSKRARLTVCGRRGAGGFQRLLVGSVTAALAHHGHSSIVVTPPPA